MTDRQIENDLDAARERAALADALKLTSDHRDALRAAGKAVAKSIAKYGADSTPYFNEDVADAALLRELESHGYLSRVPRVHGRVYVLTPRAEPFTRGGVEEVVSPLLHAGRVRPATRTSAAANAAVDEIRKYQGELDRTRRAQMNAERKARAADLAKRVPLVKVRSGVYAYGTARIHKDDFRTSSKEPWWLDAQLPEGVPAIFQGPFASLHDVREAIEAIDEQVRNAEDSPWSSPAVSRFSAVGEALRGMRNGGDQPSDWAVKGLLRRDLVSGGPEAGYTLTPLGDATLAAYDAAEAAEPAPSPDGMDAELAALREEHRRDEAEEKATEEAAADYNREMLDYAFAHPEPTPYWGAEDFGENWIETPELLDRFDPLKHSRLVLDLDAYFAFEPDPDAGVSDPLRYPRVTTEKLVERARVTTRRELVERGMSERDGDRLQHASAMLAEALSAVVTPSDTSAARTVYDRRDRFADLASANLAWAIDRAALFPDLARFLWETPATREVVVALGVEYHDATTDTLETP